VKRGAAVEQSDSGTVERKKGEREQEEGKGERRAGVKERGEQRGRKDAKGGECVKGGKREKKQVCEGARGVWGT